MSITSVCAIKAVTGEAMPNMRRYVVTYKVICSSLADGPNTIITGQGSGIPTPYTSTYSYNGDTDSEAICTKLGPVRRASRGSQYVWLIDVEFVYDRLSTPADIPLKIEPFFVSEQEAISHAVFKGWFKTTAIDTWTSEAITNTDFVVDVSTPISCSNNVPVVPPPDKRKSIPGYRVSWLRRTHIDYDLFINKTNYSSFNLTSTDVGGTVRFNKTFPAGRLLLSDVQVTEQLIYDYRWFNVTLELLDGDWRHYELDRGFIAKCESGQTDGRGGVYSVGDFVTGMPRHRRIVGPDGTVLTEPVLFDGTGLPLEEPKPENAIYSGWDINGTIEFTGLDVGGVT